MLVIIDVSKQVRPTLMKHKTNIFCPEIIFRSFIRPAVGAYLNADIRANVNRSVNCVSLICL